MTPENTNETQLKEVSPTGSYSFRVPRGVEEDIDDRTASYWIDGDPTLLQASSYARDSGVQLSSSKRLASRLSRGELVDHRDFAVDISGCADVAAASGVDEEGAHWIYVYAVWPALTVLITISHPDAEIPESAWPFQAIRSLRV